jgi:1,5-anhydro-D-fructose reductase (1,5-anhydro-D-mannitol-forming)
MACGWGIISTGRHAQAKIAPAIHAAAGATLVAVCSSNRQRAEAFAEQHGALAAYSAVEDLVGDSRVEAVCIASPNALHASQTLIAARAGKHVLTEKPMATTLDDAMAMMRACREHGVKLGVGFHLRQHPGHIEARRLLNRGLIGRVALAQGQWGFGVRGQTMPPPRPELQKWWDEPEMIGGASTMMGTGVHVVDLLRFLLGQEVRQVVAVADGQTARQPLEQLLVLSLRFEEGVIATVTCGRRLPDSRNDFSLYGSHGRISGLATLAEGRQGQLEVVSETENRTEAYATDPLANYVDEIVDFQQALAVDREPAATGLDGLRVVQVTLAMITSAREGRAVNVEPVTV